MTKLCNGCNTVWNKGDFNKDRTARDGLQSRCRWCQMEYGREYRRPSLRGRAGKKDPWFSPRWTKTAKRRNLRRVA